MDPGADPTNLEANGLISGTIEFEDKNDRWLTGVADRDDQNGFVWGLNWIRAGSYSADGTVFGTAFDDYNQNDDPNGVFEGVVVQTNVLFGGFENTGGTWAPYNLVSYFNDGPGFNNNVTNTYSKFENTNSVDIVFIPYLERMNASLAYYKGLDLRKEHHSGDPFHVECI